MSCDRWARTWLGGERGTLWCPSVTFPAWYPVRICGGGELKRNGPRSYLLSHFGNGNALGAEKERQVSVREINRGDSGLVLYLGAMGDNRQISRLVLLEATI